MPSTLDKARKKIAKKRGVLGTLHEGSRDSRRLRRALVRDERLEKLAAVRRKSEQPMADRAAYFQDVVKEKELQPLQAEEIREAIQGFVNQFDIEMAELKQARRPGRPASTREDLVKVKLAALKKEMENGFLVPDLTHKDTVELLGRWEGSWSQLNCLNWVRITNDGVLRAAIFPPNKE